MAKQREQDNQIAGQTLPGTGGDLRRSDDDVEGHRNMSGAGFSPDAPKPGEGARQGVDDGDDQDVEGHLYRTGPTTEGE